MGRLGLGWQRGGRECPQLESPRHGAQHAERAAGCSPEPRPPAQAGTPAGLMPPSPVSHRGRGHGLGASHGGSSSRGQEGAGSPRHRAVAPGAGRGGGLRRRGRPRDAPHKGRHRRGGGGRAGWGRTGRDGVLGAALRTGAKMGCFTFIKVMMILFNLAIFLSGGTLLGVGIWVKVDGESFVNIFGALSSSILQVVNVGYLFIVIGAILLVVGFLGCYGAQKESKCLLMMFFSVVLIIFIAEVAAAVLALVFTGLAETLLTGLVTPLLKEKYGQDKTFTDIWNITMTKVHCCGLNNYTDFNNSYFYRTHDSYPTQCCAMQDPCNDTLAAETKVEGCFKEILKEIRTNAGVAGGVAAGIAAVEIASMAVSMYLYCRLDEK